MGDDFGLDPRLARDCHRMGGLPCCELLLLDNALYPWFILVPRSTETELHALDAGFRDAVMDEVYQVAAYVEAHHPQIMKLNIAAIGNIVRQLHIHVVGRHDRDPAWPGVVWGHAARRAYLDDEVERERAGLIAAGLPDFRTHDVDHD
ncbi:hypothetical protein BJI67_08810 [Acidihalobacter aeolianus]|uniref:HIT domain-containing protein n=1 Tax=Acidihalobacter aeolianus TaxID=2792603 RepID=A0A1D8K875_9GAMM|nr:HIT family protein [Acidihalobacter aeolianus]AOV17146.1 hypothetical protein BJI67_08810 [Acidihalobacter aeolianus]